MILDDNFKLPISAYAPGCVPKVEIKERLINNKNMYFPRDISEIGDFLRSLKYNSNEENIRILDDILDRMRHMHGYTNKEVESLLFSI